MDIFNNRRYVIVSNWKYPFGGGEEFLFQTMSWAKQLGMKCYWLCFSTADNVPFKQFKIEKYSCGDILCLPGGINSVTIYNWLKLINPDYVHHQGGFRQLIFEACDRQRIELMTGFHFWTGGIILNPEYKNIDILKHADKHSTSDEFKFLVQKSRCNMYAVTPFVSKCIEAVTGTKLVDTVYSSSSYKKCKMENFVPNEAKYVTIINCHRLKGGEIGLYLIKNCPDIPFLIVKTEYMSEDLDKQIEDAILERTDVPCKMMERVDDPTIIYRQTRIMLVPSLVDETFCRVANEVMMNGIPVITTGQGNLSDLVDTGGIIVKADNLEGWKDAVVKLSNDKDLYKEYSERSLQQYDKFSEQKAFTLFKKLSTKIIKKSKEMNIMIFTPWCDQGLGIQSRNYADILHSLGYNIFILGLKPYNADSCLAQQKDPSEWSKYTVYYSTNDRESVTDIEITTCVKKWNIGKCIVPETCWFRVFEVAKLLRRLDVKSYAIPNIEIVRKDEVYKHRYFYKILCNNMLCHDVFSSFGLNNLEYVGYGMPENSLIQMKQKNITDDIKFLFIGGMNAFSRKNMLLICKGFVDAYDKIGGMQLTCTIQKINLLEQDIQDELMLYINHPAINLIQEHMPYSSILQLYYDHHVSIQMSKHEGLGLGFYEAVCTGTPVISLDTAPHNEIITDNNGWIVPCYYKKMVDNKDPIFDSAYFKTEDLTDKLVEIVSDKNSVTEKINTLKTDYENRIHIRHFTERFVAGLR